MGRKKNSKSALKKNAKKRKNKQSKKSKNNAQKKPKLDDKDAAALFDRIKEFNRDITIHKLTVEPINGGADLIEECDLKLTHGHRYGLIGYNGAGKSTLLKKLASGTIKEIPSYLRVLHTHQELKGDQNTVLETVLKSDKTREYLLKKQLNLKKELEIFADENKDNQQNNKRNFDDVMKELQDIVERLNFIESDTAESRASNLLNGLGFNERMKNMFTADLSGGWRMRVSIACALFIEPDLLLLDEPTNHLDFPSVLWLTDYLNFSYNHLKTIVIVSHDRRFLNNCCTDIIHLNNRKLIFYTGNYDQFIKIKNENKINQNKQYEKQQKMIKHNEEFIAKFAANKKWSTQAQSRKKLLSRIDRIEKVCDDLIFNFSFPQPVTSLRNPLMINFDDVTFGYFGCNKADTFILKNINIKFNYGQKVGILGGNGAGKSTLIKLIMKKISPLFGTASLTNSVQIGYFSQHHINNLNLNLTPLQQLEKEFGSANCTKQQLFAQLGRFSIDSILAQRKIGSLSGGQKSRITFAILTWYSPHLIIMDEPTNHLDIPTIDGLANALKKFNGSILIVSHDQHFVETCCSEYWCIGNKKIKIFNNFNQCITYSKTCKIPNNLPREYKNKKKIPIKSNINEEKKEKENIIPNNINNINNKWDINIEREIDRGLKKGLTPNGILRHCRGWKAIDGDYMIVNKLGFLIFLKYFDSSINIDHNDFFKEWKNLLNYCIPQNHNKNQLKLINISIKCFMKAYKDSKINAINPATYSFGLILESIVTIHNIINISTIKMFANKSISGSDNKYYNNNKIALDQMKLFITIAEEEEEEENTDSDSD